MHFKLKTGTALAQLAILTMFCLCGEPSAKAACTEGYGYNGLKLDKANKGASASITLGAARTLCTGLVHSSHDASWAGSNTGTTAWAQTGYIQDTVGTGSVLKSYWEVKLPGVGYVMTYSGTVSSGAYSVQYSSRAWQCTNPAGTKTYRTSCKSMSGVQYHEEIYGLENYFYGTAAAPVTFSHCGILRNGTWQQPTGWSVDSTMNARMGVIYNDSFTAWDSRG